MFAPGWQCLPGAGNVCPGLAMFARDVPGVQRFAIAIAIVIVIGDLSIEN